MRLGVSYLSHEKKFHKAMRRIRPIIDSIEEQFEAVVLKNPIHEAILIGLIDEKPTSYLEEIPNRDGYFQVNFGVGHYNDIANEGDSNLTALVVEKIIEAIKLCPFSKVDLEQYEKCFTRWEVEFLENNS